MFHLSVTLRHSTIDYTVESFTEALERIRELKKNGYDIISYNYIRKDRLMSSIL
jgi:hypothetical protein